MTQDRGDLQEPIQPGPRAQVDAASRPERAVGSPLAAVNLPTPNPPWTVVIVEDSDDYRLDVVEQLRKSDVAYGNAPNVIPLKDFSEAETVLSSQTVDVVILDVREDGGDDHAGELVLEKLQQTRFVPVVFYTAYADRVQHLQKIPVVQIVGKEEKTDVLLAAVRAAFDSDLPAAVRSLSDHVREVTREYLWDHVSAQWNELAEYGVEEKTALLVARLARSLDLTLALEGSERLRGPIGRAMAAESLWHPSRIYVLPPMGSALEFDTGDLLLHDSTGRYWVQLTPSCDLANSKASRHLLVAANPLFEVDPFEAWRAADSEWAAIEGDPMPPGGWAPELNSRRKKLKSDSKDLRGKCAEILQGKMERFFHLPRFLHVPDLLLDLQHVQTPEDASMGEYRRIAGLAPPWPQVLVNRYNRQTGRIGYDDPNAQAILDRMSLEARGLEG